MSWGKKKKKRDAGSIRVPFLPSTFFLGYIGDEVGGCRRGGGVGGGWDRMRGDLEHPLARRLGFQGTPGGVPPLSLPLRRTTRPGHEMENLVAGSWDTSLFSSSYFEERGWGYVWNRATICFETFGFAFLLFSYEKWVVFQTWFLHQRRGGYMK